MKIKLLLFVGLLLVMSGTVLAQQDTAAVPDSQRVYRSLPEALRNPDKVYRLDLSKKKLLTVPPEVFLFRNLKFLSLSRNRLKQIPPEIGNLTSLEILDMSRNSIYEVPPEIGRLKNLKELILYQNEIDSISPQIGQLASLEKLDLWENELSTLPEEMKNLRKLQEVDLRGILFSQKQHLYFRELMPGVMIYISPGCNTCKDP